ncbi:MAG: hypothetical protein E6K35_09190 [Gammaproteobacteria bacterium]|nr:MAG: hypothetical protein E6K47_12545 [Gammaproteobacteria bacterium]TLY86304.1 MAG: hypothetical protein E6K35_09190 [Gammaproteobacteria bacterium]
MQRGFGNVLTGLLATSFTATGVMALAHARTVVFDGDHDVFGDGRSGRCTVCRTRKKSTATPNSRELIERVLKEKNAQLWIGHSTAFFKNAIKSPGWYD